jgi:Icc-related predicted phosphoesterase
MMRVAAVGDLHAGVDSRGAFAEAAREVHLHADVLVLAGDLTRVGQPDEAESLAADLELVRVPVVAVLGNHDFHSDLGPKVVDVLEAAGVWVLDGGSTVVRAGECSIGIAGGPGFGGGFADATATAFGEPEMKAFVARTERMAHALEESLSGLEVDLRVALLHYSPIPGTLRGERPEIFPFLGSYLLGEAIDRAGCDLVVHGHAHGGVEKGTTPGGVPVRNVARPVIRCPYAVYSFESAEEKACRAPALVG